MMEISIPEDAIGFITMSATERELLKILATIHLRILAKQQVKLKEQNSVDRKESDEVSENKDESALEGTDRSTLVENADHQKDSL